MLQSVGTFFGLTIGETALNAASVGEEVTGNNISNASTTGYDDETLNMTEGDPVDTGIGSLGSGVDASSVTRSTDQFLTAQTNTANSAESSLNAQSTWLTNAQNVLNGTGTTSINTELETFFQNFNSISSDPGNTGAYTTAIGGGQTLAEMFNTASSSLTSASTQISTAITNDQASVNSLGQQIASLNGQIQQTSAQGQQPNTLLDQLDTLVNQLSSLTNVTVVTNPNSTVNVNIGSTNLVSGTNANTVTAAALQSNGDLTSGELAGLETSQSSLAGYQTDLNNLASQVITQVNTVSEAGTAADGTTGIPIFTGTDASDIAVNATLVSDPNELPVGGATTPAGTPPASGDTSTATAIANLATTTLGASAGALSGQTFEGYFNQTVTQLATQLNTVSSNLTTAQATSTQLTNQLDSETGVNEDNELTNMLQYQNMYEAATKVITTQNDMLQSLIDIVIPTS